MFWTSQCPVTAVWTITDKTNWGPRLPRAKLPILGNPMVNSGKKAIRESFKEEITYGLQEWGGFGRDWRMALQGTCKASEIRKVRHVYQRQCYVLNKAMPFLSWVLRKTVFPRLPCSTVGPCDWALDNRIQMKPMSTVSRLPINSSAWSFILSPPLAW